MCVSLLPSDIGDIYAGIRRNIYQFLMRYNESLGGVLLAVSDLSFGDGAREGRIEDEMPHIHFDVKAKAQVFCPRPGHVLEGRVNKVTSTHVGMLVCGIFNASVASDSMGEGFRFDLTAREWRKRGRNTGGEGSEAIAVGTNLKFAVTRMHEAAGLISMEGSLEGLRTKGGGNIVGAESAVANPNKRRAASAVTSSPEAMEEDEAAAAAAAAKAAKATRKKAKKAAKLAAKAAKESMLLNVNLSSISATPTAVAAVLQLSRVWCGGIGLPPSITTLRRALEQTDAIVKNSPTSAGSLLPDSESLPQEESAETKSGAARLRALTTKSPGSSDNDSVGDCILIQLGVLDKGNLGDVTRPVALKRLLASATPPNQCFWYAHPWVEDAAGRGEYTAQFSNGETSRFVPVSTDYAEEVNRFKALVIGGGGFFKTKYTQAHPDIEIISERLTLPIIVMGAAASYHAKQCSTILQKAVFVSGRDASSTKVLADVVHRGPASAILVRDAVLSDNSFTDIEGKCWRQSTGEHQQPLCFILPPTNKPSTVEMHRQLVEELVTPEDVFVNVFPKHHNDDELRDYPGEVQQILDPKEFMERLCSCRAIVSTNFNAAVLGLHMGVPTLGAFRESPTNEVRELMIDALDLPNQYVIVDEHLNRAGLNVQVEDVRRRYASDRQRASIHDRLSAFHDEFVSYAHHVFFGIIDVQQEKGSLPAGEQATVSSLWSSASAGADDGPIVQKPTDERSNADHNGRSSLAATLLSAGILSKLPQDIVAPSSGGLDLTHKVFDEAAVAMQVDHRHASNAGLVSSSGEAPEDGLLIRVIKNPYTASIFLVTAIVWIALVLSGGGAARRPPSAKLVSNDVALWDETDDVTYAQSDGGSRTSSDSDLTTLTERSPTTLRGCSDSAAAGIAATSYKRVFMLNFAAWVSLTMGFSGYGKAYLGDTRDPIGLLVLQGATGVVLLCVLAWFGVMDLHPGKDLTPAAAQQAGLAAIFHASQALFANFAVLVGGLAVTNALKAMEPVAAAAFSYLLLGKTCSGSRMAAIATIVAGMAVLITSAGGGSGVQEAVGEAEDRETFLGSDNVVLTSAAFTMAAVCCNALRNVVIKRGSPIPPHQTLLNCSATAAVVGVALMLLRFTFRSIYVGILERGGSGHGGGDGKDSASSWVRMDGVNAALCFVGYNLASFNLLLRLSPVGHSVGNSCKDVVVSAGALLLLGEVMSIPQLGGTAVALLGVLGYNVAGTR
eukprot:g8514.t1